MHYRVFFSDFIRPYINDFRYDFTFYLIPFWSLFFKQDAIANGGSLFRVQFLFLSTLFDGFIYTNVYFSSIAKTLYFLRIQQLIFNLSYYVWQVISRKLYLQIINYGKTQMIYTKSNDMSLNNSSKKIIISIKIFDLHGYSFSSYHIMKSLK